MTHSFCTKRLKHLTPNSNAVKDLVIVEEFAIPMVVATVVTFTSIRRIRNRNNLVWMGDLIKQIKLLII